MTAALRDFELADDRIGSNASLRDVRGMSGLTPTADISGPSRHFALGPEADFPTCGKRPSVREAPSTLLWPSSGLFARLGSRGVIR